MRDAKGLRLWNKLPEDIRRTHQFIEAESWRDDKAVWFRCKRGSEELMLRMNRATGELLP